MQNKTLIVMAEFNLHNDLSKIEKSIIADADYMAVNAAGAICLKPIKYWATYHPNCFPGYACIRGGLGGNTDYETHSHTSYINNETGKEMVNHIWPLPKVNPGYTDFKSGSSVLFGVEVGLNLGYDQIIICGAPLEVEKYQHFREAWKRALPLLKGKVTSMSGWTKDLLTEQENKTQEVL
jgi:hypothetical protein